MIYHMMQKLSFILIQKYLNFIDKWFVNLVSRHLSECGIKLLSDGLKLILLSHKLIL